MKDLQDLLSTDTSEVSLKAKVRWAIKVDENSQYFHGILNKNRSHLAIRGILLDGEWISDPYKVKSEFLKHFSSRFSTPHTSRLILDFQFPKRLNLEQSEDLESFVSYDEIKRAVRDCGTNKSPCPDGFSFDFIRKFWNIIDEDVVAAVKDFLLLLSSLEVVTLLLSLLFRKFKMQKGGVEDEQFSNLISCTSTFILPQIEDRGVWSLSSTGDFSVNSARSFIDDKLLPSFDSLTRWVKVIPIKINILAWRVWQDKLPTNLNISLRGQNGNKNLTRQRQWKRKRCLNSILSSSTTTITQGAVITQALLEVFLEDGNVSRIGLRRPPSWEVHYCESYFWTLQAMNNKVQTWDIPSHTARKDTRTDECYWVLEVDSWWELEASTLMLLVSVCAAAEIERKQSKSLVMFVYLVSDLPVHMFVTVVM
ncbi:hypothetical protein Tco_0037871 [Tanacetum coccineum]